MTTSTATPGTTTAPRTRRQLRAALEEAQDLLASTRRMADSNQHDANTYYDRYCAAAGALRKADFTRVDTPDGETWITSAAAAAKLYTQADLDRAREDANTRVAHDLLEMRRDTLTKVIEALELTEYDDARRVGFYNVPDATGADRFWADITTALEVRAENKKAAERTATEQKVANLAKRPTYSPSLALIDEIPLFWGPYADLRATQKPKPAKKPKKKPTRPEGDCE